MAVLKMCKINICGMKKDRKKILEHLQLKGCLEIHEEEKEDEIFQKMNTSSSISLYERQTALAENALDILEMYAPENKSMFSALEGKHVISAEEYCKMPDTLNDIYGVITNIIEQKKTLDEKENEKQKCVDEIQALEPWKNLDVPMNFQGTKTTDFMVGIIAGTYTDIELIQKIQNIKEFPKNVHIQIVFADKYQTYICITYIKNDLEKVEKALRQLDFSKPPVMAHHIPSISVEKRLERIAECNMDIENIKAKLEKDGKQRLEIKKSRDYYKIRADKYRILGNLLQAKHTFFATGYIPESKASELKDELEEKYVVAFDREDVKENEDIPVILTNGKVTGAVEGVVTSFGYPKKHEIDPTVITSFFYYFLFGIMLSDAAYGFLMFIGCFILLKKFPNMEETMANTFRMFMYCGISTLIWGILFGGYFGDVVTVVGKTFFDVDIGIPALWFEPIKEPMKMLIYCLEFGIIHLFTGLGIKGYMMLKQKDVTGFICDVILWYIFLTGLILLLLPTDIFSSLAGINIVYPVWLSVLSKAFAIFGMVGILLMAGRRAKNPAKRLMLGAYSLYDTTSWLGDLLSYSRLLALGLATGVIAQVINTMASMMGKSVMGVIFFMVVFVIGHTFNMAINLLGAYVHTNRLQFVEFFGKFYEGGGREFKPFRADTKYIKVKN